MEKKQLSIIVAIVAVIIIIAAAAVILMNNNDSKEPTASTIEINSGVDISADLISDASKEYDAIEVVIASESSKITQKIKADAISVLKKDKTALTISTKSGASVTLDTATVAALAASDVELDLDTSTSSAEIEKDLGADSGAKAIVYASLGEISKLGGKATVKAPYTLKSGEDSKKVEIWYTYVDSEGVRQYEEYPATYSNGFVTFTTTHFSKFFIAFMTLEEAGFKPAPEYSGTCNLWVYGNVNGDDVIDEKDIALLEKILDGRASEVFVHIYDGYNATGNETYISFADANGDGKLTKDDVKYIEDMIGYEARYSAAVDTGKLATFTEKFTLFYNDVDNVKSSVTLPVKSMISIYFSNSEIVRLLGATDRVVAVDQTTLNKATMLPEFQKFMDDNDHIVDRFNPNSEQVLKIAADVYFTGSRATYGPNLEKEVGNVTEIVRLPAWEDNNEMAASLTFGYILGSTTMAYKYIDWANGYIDLVTERLKENDHDVMSIIVPKGRKESLEGNGLGSGQYEISELAGGNNLAKQLPATSEYPDFTIEWALTANPDLIVLSGYCGYEKTDVKVNVTDVMATAYKTYAHTAAADNGRIYFISNEIFTGPSAYIAMVYLATWMYPEIFADIDAEAVFQEYLDTFCPQMSSYDISAHILQHVCGPCATIDSAKLKVFGNVDGNEVIDSNDLAQIQLYVAAGLSADLCPMADANQDGKIDNADVEVIEKIIAGESTVVYHVNYHDADGNGTMDMEIVSTKYPISSAIMTGSANSFMLTYLLGILDEIKGASYGSTNDKALYGSNYLDTSKTVKLGTSSSSITFEDGKAGSSDVIAKEHVTAVISDWNRTYITNEAAFEGANVDVVRVAAASVDPNVYTHSILLLGFLFQKEEKAQQLLSLYNKVFESIDEALAGLSDEQIVKAVASSMTGYISSGESDYQAVVAAAGAKFGLEGYDFGGSASMKVVDHLDVYDTSKYSFDYIVQIRTALTYENLSADTLNKNWKSYTDAFNLWEHADDGQILVSGVIPVPLRVAYAACGMYSDVLSLDWANGLHKEFVDAFYAGSFDVDSLVFIMTAPVATA